MREHCKRMVAGLLAILMALTLLPAPALADGSYEEDGYIVVSTWNELSAAVTRYETDTPADGTWKGIRILTDSFTWPAAGGELTLDFGGNGTSDYSTSPAGNKYRLYLCGSSWTIPQNVTLKLAESMYHDASHGGTDLAITVDGTLQMIASAYFTNYDGTVSVTVNGKLDSHDYSLNWSSTSVRLNGTMDIFSGADFEHLSLSAQSKLTTGNYVSLYGLALDNGVVLDNSFSATVKGGDIDVNGSATIHGSLSLRTYQYTGCTLNGDLYLDTLSLNGEFNVPAGSSLRVAELRTSSSPAGILNLAGTLQLSGSGSINPSATLNLQEGGVLRLGAESYLTGNSSMAQVITGSGTLELCAILARYDNGEISYYAVPEVFGTSADQTDGGSWTALPGMADTVTVTRLWDGCDHQWGAASTVDPTCASEGHSACFCSSCGTELRSDFVPMGGNHVPLYTVNRYYPSSLTVECALCGTYGGTVQISAKDGVYNSGKPVETATLSGGPLGKDNWDAFTYPDIVYTNNRQLGTATASATFAENATIYATFEVVKCLHQGGTATCRQRAICTLCGEEYGELADHDLWLLCDEDRHWVSCTGCGTEFLADYGDDANDPVIIARLMVECANKGGTLDNALADEWMRLVQTQGLDPHGHYFGTEGGVCCGLCGYTEKPGAPRLNISNVSSTGKLKLSWDAVDGAKKYYIYRSTDGKTYKYYDSTTSTSYTNTSVTPGTKYYYKAKTVDANGNTSEYSNVVSRTADCAKPSLSSSIVTSSGAIRLSWKAVDGAAKYYIYRSIDSGKNYSYYTSTTSTSWTNSSVNPGTKYYYKIKAICSNTEGNSAYSNVVYRTADCAKPSLSSSIVTSSGAIKLSWSKVTGAAKYYIYRSTDGSTYKYYSSTTSTSWTNSSVTPGTKYYYKIKAICANTDGNSAYSNVVSRTADCAKPSLSSSIVSSSGAIKLSWSKVTGATKYYIYRSTDGGKTYSYYSSTTSTSWTNSSVTPGKTYYYKIKAICSNTEGNSAYSNVVSRTADCAKPSVTIQLNDGKPQLKWKAVTGAKEYVIYRATSKTGTYTKLYTTTKLSYTNSGAKSGTTYYYKVMAVCKLSSYGNSAYSNIVSIKSK